MNNLISRIIVNGEEYMLQNKPVNPVILDTDFGGDIDDIHAVAALCWAERMGLAQIVGICSCVPRFGMKNGIKYDVISAIDAICCYFGVNNVAYGLDKTYYTHKSNYCATACSYQYTTDSLEAYDAPEFYRRALTALPDNVKCKVAIVGYLTAFSKFLDSAADDISSKSGREIAEEKIEALYIMGGSYPNGSPETNISGGGREYPVNATKNIIENFKGNIYWLGGEQGDIKVGHILWDNKMEWSCLYKCMLEFMKANFERRQSEGSLPPSVTDLETHWKYYDFAWDPETVLAMIDNNTNITGYDLVRGNNDIITEEGENYGKNVFTENETGNHFYFKKKKGKPAKWFSERLDNIIKEDNWLSLSDESYRLPRYDCHRKETVFDLSITPESIRNIVNLPITAKKGSILYIWIDELPPTNEEFENSTINFYQYNDYTHGTFCAFSTRTGITFDGAILIENRDYLYVDFWTPKNIEYIFHCKLIELIKE